MIEKNVALGPDNGLGGGMFILASTITASGNGTLLSVERNMAGVHGGGLMLYDGSIVLVKDGAKFDLNHNVAYNSGGKA